MDGTQCMKDDELLDFFDGTKDLVVGEFQALILTEGSSCWIVSSTCPHEGLKLAQQFPHCTAACERTYLFYVVLLTSTSTPSSLDDRICKVVRA